MSGEARETLKLTNREIDSFLRRILIIDDNPDIYRDCKSILASEQGDRLLSDLDKELFGDSATMAVQKDVYHMEFASQGQEGLNKVLEAVSQGLPFMVAFVDMQMPPGWDGLETIERIWQVDPEVQIVIFTAYSDYSWTEITQRLGKTDKLVVLKKPFDAVEVAQLASALTQKWILHCQVALNMDELDAMVVERTRELEQSNRNLREALEKIERAEEVLAESEEKYRSVVERANDGIIVIQDSLVKYANPRVTEISGYSNNELIDTPFLDYVLPDEVPEVIDRYTRRMAGEEAASIYETRLRDKNGQPVDVELNASVVSYQGKTVDLVFIRDSRERKQAEEVASRVRRLEELDHLRTVLMASVSHELRSPLTSIKGLSDSLVLPDVEWDPETQTEFLNAINLASDRLNQIIDDILDSTKLEASAMTMMKTQCGISNTISQLSYQLNGLVDKHRLETNIQPKLPVIYVDEVRIGQVITNLVANAASYSDEGTRIILEASRDDSEIVVSVTDEGIGIPPDHIDKVFDQFYRLEEGVTRRRGGSGLGLSICKGIVEAHDGRIWVESKLGEGSKFSFSLPVVQDIMP